MYIPCNTDHACALLQHTSNNYSNTHQTTTPTHIKQLLQHTSNNYSNTHQTTTPTHIKQLLQHTSNNYSNTYQTIFHTDNLTNTMLQIQFRKKHQLNSSDIIFQDNTAACMGSFLPLGNYCTNTKCKPIHTTVYRRRAIHMWS